MTQSHVGCLPASCSLQGIRFIVLNVTSRGHELFTEEVNKVALSAEDKRVIRTDGVLTFAIGHYRNHK